jgi:hypothetical protein
MRLRIGVSLDGELVTDIEVPAHADGRVEQEFAFSLFHWCTAVLRRAGVDVNVGKDAPKDLPAAPAAPAAPAPVAKKAEPARAAVAPVADQGAPSEWVCSTCRRRKLRNASAGRQAVGQEYICPTCKAEDAVAAVRAAKATSASKPVTVPTAKRSVRDSILEELAAHDAKGTKEVPMHALSANIPDYNVETIRAEMSKLVVQGKVKRIDRGVFALPSAEGDE